MGAVTDEIGNEGSVPQLHTGALGLVEVIGQSLGAIAPTLTIFLGNFLNAFGMPMNPAAMSLVMLIFIAAVTYAAYRDIKFSSRVGLALEIVSIGIIIVITAMIVRVQGTVIDRAQLGISSFKYGAVFSALPFVIFSFVGFESSATLGASSAPFGDVAAKAGLAWASTIVYFSALICVFACALDRASQGHGG